MNLAYKTTTDGNGKVRCFRNGVEVSPAVYVAGYFEQNGVGPTDSKLNIMASSPSLLVTAAANSSERFSHPDHFGPAVRHG